MRVQPRRRQLAAFDARILQGHDNARLSVQLKIQYMTCIEKAHPLEHGFGYSLKLSSVFSSQIFFHGRFSSSLPIEHCNIIQGITDIQISNLHNYLKYTNSDSQLPFMVCALSTHEICRNILK